MSGSPRIRSAAAGDVPFVRDECGSYLSPDVLLELIVRQDLLVAERDDQPIGYAALDRLGAVHPFLAAIRVLEWHRGRGIGRALLAEVESRVRARGHAVLYSSSSADEPAPQEWHRHVGFTECGFVAGLNVGRVGEVLFRKSLG